MELYLIRHAHAVDGAGLYDDDVRPLSEKGRQQALDVGHALKKHHVRFGRVVTSGLVRAVETAQILAAVVGHADPLEVYGDLRPEGNVYNVLCGLIQESDQRVPLTLVGHEPSMGRILSSLIGQRGLSLDKCQVVKLDYELHGKVIWTLTPKRLDPSPTL